MSAFANKPKGWKPERTIQKEITEMLRKRGILFTSTCGGVAYQVHQLKNLKDTGYLKGVPDLVVFEARGEFHGLFMEVKTAKGRLSPDQLKVGQHLTQRGYLVTVVRSLEDAENVLNMYLQLEAPLVEVRRKDERLQNPGPTMGESGVIAVDDDEVEVQACEDEENSGAVSHAVLDGVSTADDRAVETFSSTGQVAELGDGEGGLGHAVDSEGVSLAQSTVVDV